MREQYLMLSVVCECLDLLIELLHVSLLYSQTLTT
jgi:hypothetical protein